MPLTDLQIRNAKPREKPYKLGDSQGLFLLVQPTGGRLWRLKYRIAGKEKKLALGTYPETSLSDARRGRDEARALIALGKDPSLEKQRKKARARVSAGNTFDAIAAEYIGHKSRDGAQPWAERTKAKAEWLKSELSPDIGRIPVAEIEPADILAAIKKLEAAGKLETAKRALQFVGSVMRYGVATSRLASDPSRDLKGAILTPKVTHRAAILDPVEFGGLLRAIGGYQGNASTYLALRLAPHVFQRPGELRRAEWSEIDLEAAVWTIPAEKMKMRRPHVVPLSRQSVAILREAEDIRHEGVAWVFPSVRSAARPISENTLNGALRRLGYTKEQATAHGFRATATTLLNESGKWSPDAIERALAHADKDTVRAAYNRGAYWDERVEMAQWWSDYLDTLRDGGEVLPFIRPGAKGA
ncbi:MAG: integrase arm-type DNA-binding domain-containing protein [Erythrobacter sp.]|jgi:integrase|nr:integrase arm-type DNA-binding domain-containing protein [Erythrobacter sp.]